VVNGGYKQLNRTIGCEAIAGLWLIDGARSVKRQWLIPIALSMLCYLLAICSVTAAQETATSEVPPFVSPGEFLNFTIRLDKAPNFDGGSIQFNVVGPNGTNIQRGVPVASGQTQCPAGIRIPEAAPPGQWHLHIISFFTGIEQRPLKSTDVVFEVTSERALTFPSSAEITVNLSQVQLLKTAAIQLQSLVQNLKASLARSQQEGTANVQDTIRNAIDSALKSIKDTELKFRQLAKISTEPHLETERIFFDDLRISYDEVLRSLARNTFPSGPGNTHIRAVSTIEADNRPGLSDNLLIQAALRPFEQNEAAYEVVADTQSLTFDLSVNSAPAGAAICYHRRGDSCRPNPDPTNTVIRSLVYAIWMVQFRKPGYEPEEREHDPFREPSHVVIVYLRLMGKLRGRK
jgi:hypothetical protein